MLSANQVAERLDDCFPLLTSERAAGVPERHQTMRATLDWSYELLAPAERTALRRLAVFPGDFDLEAAIAVVEADAAPLGDGDPEGFTSSPDSWTSRSSWSSALVTTSATGCSTPFGSTPPRSSPTPARPSVLRRRHRDLFLARQESCGL